MRVSALAAMLSRLCLLCLLCATSASVAHAAARTAIRVQMNGQAPPGAERALRRYLRGCLARDVSAAPLLVVLRWSRVGHRSQVVVDVTWGAARLGARLLEGVDPSALLEAAAVATCVALDHAVAQPAVRRRALRRPSAAARRCRRLGPEKQPTSHRPAPQATRPNGGPTLRGAEHPDRWHAYAGTLISLGLAPAFTGGVSIGFGRRHRYGSVRLSLRALVPAQLRAGAGKVQSSTVGLAFLFCGHLGPLAVCPLATAGLRSSSSSGLDQVATRRTIDGEYGGRVRIARAVTRGLHVAIWIEATLPWIRTRLRVNDLVVWKRDGLAASLGLEIGWRPG